MYSSHARLCLSACQALCPRPYAHILRGPGCNLGEWYQLCTIYWADLQSVHGLRCCGNSANAKCQRVLILCLCLVFSLSSLATVKGGVHSAPDFILGVHPPVLAMHRTARSNKIVGKLPDGLLYGERDGAVLNRGTVLTADDDSPSVVTPVIEYLFTSPDCRVLDTSRIASRGSTR